MKHHLIALLAAIVCIGGAVAASGPSSDFNYRGYGSFPNTPNFKYEGEKKPIFNYRGNPSFPNTPNFEYHGERQSTFNYRGNDSFPNTPNFYYPNSDKR